MVVWFGVVSLLTDASGELIYPLLPLFLITQLGAPLPFVGLIEGIAEATASLFRVISGRIADRLPRKKPLVLLGYGLASFARPVMALAGSPWTVLLVRFADRLGKGLRSSPRDAMLADATPAAQRGAAYGYHRAMDNAGAVLGPLTGFVLLRFGHLPLRTIFALAAIPAVIAVTVLIFRVRELPRSMEPISAAGAAPLDPAHHGGEGAPSPGEHHRSRQLKAYLAFVALFTLGNSADAFLLVRAAQVLHPGVALGPSILADPEILLLWTGHNLTKALLSQAAGAASDRLGRRPMIALGWMFYAGCYLWFALATSRLELWLLFPLYGVYYALVEGPERALVSDLAPPARRGAAFGWFHGLVGLASLPASLLFGLLYREYGALTAFGTSATLAALAALGLWLVVQPPRGEGAT